MPNYAWTTDVDQARKDQITLSGLVSLTTSPAVGDMDTGLAIGTSYDENTNSAFAIGVRFNKRGKIVGEPITERVEVNFDYIPGLLAYRVGSAICKLLDSIKRDFQFIVCDGQGVAHSRGLGLASHIGVLYDICALGVTRQRLYGDFVEPMRGWMNASELRHPRTGALCGYAVSLGERCKPIFVSPGHRLSLVDTLALMRQISRPESCFQIGLRRAHAVANAASGEWWRSHTEANDRGVCG